MDETLEGQPDPKSYNPYTSNIAMDCYRHFPYVTSIVINCSRDSCK